MLRHTNLIAVAKGSKDRFARKAAVGERAIKIAARLRPVPPAPNGFVDPDGFIAVCKARDAQNALRREAYWRIAHREFMRGRFHFEDTRMHRVNVDPAFRAQCAAKAEAECADWREKCDTAARRPEVREQDPRIVAWERSR